MHEHAVAHYHHERLQGAARAVRAHWVKRLDAVMYVIGALGLVMTIPQVVEIWVYHNASGVSALSWGSYFIFSIFWLVYAIAHRTRVLIFTQALWVVFNALIAIGAMKY